MIGRLLSGRYRVEAVVGTGGTAVVYRALDTQENRVVAIKVLRPEYASDQDFVRRFSHEAQTAAKMTHENIVNLLDVGIDNDVRYIVMEYVEGHTLKELIREQGPIPPEQALPMALRILAAVDHAHRNGIVHRDIKSQNILVDSEGKVKVADFGIARVKTQPGDDADRRAVGSVHYLSPEQARGELTDERSDLYSVGVVLYEMLTGHVPFDGDSVRQVMLMQVSATPRSMRETDANISRALDEVVMRALCKDKRQRYQSATEMAADLRKTIEQPEGGFVVYPEIPPEPGSAKDGEETHHVRDALKAVAVMLVISAVVALVFWLRNLSISVSVPELTGETEAEAVADLQALELQPTLVRAYSDDYAEGQVMLQSTAAGERLRKGSALTLTVSMGSAWYMLEDMRGWDRARAEAALSAAGVVNFSVEAVQSEQPVDTVISMSAGPGWTSRDTPILLQVSGACVSVPDLTGMDQDAARSVIEAGGLTLGDISVGDSADARSGSVISQSIPPYTRVLAGTTLDITVCRDHGLRYAPDSALTLYVPLNDLAVRIELVLPDGSTEEVYTGRLPKGTHSVSLRSDVSGEHEVRIYYADTLFETLRLDFE